MTINFLAVLVAGVASWLAGAVWYGVLGKVWQGAVGWREGEARPGPAVPMIVSIVVELFMALMLAGLIGHQIGGPITVTQGLVAGVLSWLSFVLPAGVVNNAFQGRKILLTVIDSAHWLIVLLIQGGVIGAFG